jgi:predicted transcriptional regulator of viral defense system
MDVPEGIREVAEWQEWVVSRQQLLRSGISSRTITQRLARQRWQQLYRGVYALFTGTPTRSQQLWAAVLRAGPGAALSHFTAAELHKLVKPSVESIHVTIPATRRVVRVEGYPRIVVHISHRIEAATQLAREPARTTLEETVLDLTQLARTIDDVVAWITRGINSRSTTEGNLRKALAIRKKVHWRAELDDILQAAGNGVHSPLEYRYYRDVERAHGLPAGRRQVKVTLEGKTAYRDAYYEEYRVVVELDGLEFHPSHNRPEDRHRDVVSSAEGIETCRYGWPEVAGQPCETALWQARVLRRHGWKGSPTSCGPGCPVGRAFRTAA